VEEKVDPSPPELPRNPDLPRSFRSRAHREPLVQHWSHTPHRPRDKCRIQGVSPKVVLRPSPSSSAASRVAVPPALLTDPRAERQLPDLHHPLPHSNRPPLPQRPPRPNHPPQRPQRPLRPSRPPADCPPADCPPGDRPPASRPPADRLPEVRPSEHRPPRQPSPPRPPQPQRGARDEAGTRPWRASRR
jgi:hypothetical protein